MSKKLPRHYYNDFFQVNYYFYIGWKPEDFIGHIKKQFDYQTEIAPSTLGKCLDYSDSSTSVVSIWIRNRTDYASLAHECVHAANATLDYMKYKYNIENDEINATLTGLIFRKALEK